jgi:hypothetical protein
VLVVVETGEALLDKEVALVLPKDLAHLNERV